MKIQLNKLKQSFEFMRFYKRQLEIVFQCFEENRSQIKRDLLWRKKPGGCF